MWGFLFVLGGLFLLSSEGYTLCLNHTCILMTCSQPILREFPRIVCWKITRCEVLPCMLISKVLGIMVQKQLVKMNVCGMLFLVPPIVA